MKKSMRKVTVILPDWMSKEGAQEEVMRNLHARALLKMELYRSKMKPFEAKYGTTFPRFQRQLSKRSHEDFTVWDDLMEWEACYRAYREWKQRHAELRQWLGR